MKRLRPVLRLFRKLGLVSKPASVMRTKSSANKRSSDGMSTRTSASNMSVFSFNNFCSRALRFAPPVSAKPGEELGTRIQTPSAKARDGEIFLTNIDFLSTSLPWNSLALIFQLAHADLDARR